jgi:hypothetical protein
MKRYLSVILIVWVSCTLFAQVKVESELDSTQIRIGEQVKLKVRVSTSPQAKVVFPSYKPEQQLTEGVEVVETTRDTIREEQRTIVCSYTLTSFDEATYTLPALPIVVNGKTYQTRPMKLLVETVPVDTTNAEVMDPAYDVEDNPFLWTEWAAPVSFFLLSALLCFLIYLMAKRLKSKKPIRFQRRIVKKVLPHEKALQAIDALSATSHTTAEEQKDYYTELTDVLRQYLDERFGINAMEMTSSEIIDRLQQEDPGKIDELKEVFQTADLVKFAKYFTYDNESDFYLSSVVHFIEETKQADTEQVVEVKEELSDDDKQLIRTRRMLKALIAAAVIAIIALLVVSGMRIYELTI